MIIKNDQTKTSLKPILLLVGLLFTLGLILFIFFKKETSPLNPDDIFCDMEKVIEGKLVYGNHQFDNAHTRSNERARSGKYSSKIDPNQSYGVKYELKKFSIGDKVCASIWKWSSIANEGILSAQGNDGTDFFVQSKEVVEIKDDWEKIQLCFEIPDNSLLTTIKIFPYNLGKEATIYFDDLEIKNQTQKQQSLISELSEFKQLDLYIDNSGMRKLSEIRDEALRYGILVNNDKYEDAKLLFDGKSQDVKIRLKGDWTDHLEGNRWSYRIKTAKDDAWNRMQTFSLQSPERRFYVKEWLFHDFLEFNDVLTSRYDFVWLKLNDRNPQLFAYEEHFDKHLPEYKKRREGVILKFSEDAAWEQRLRSKKEIGHHDSKLLDDKFNSDILPFKESRLESDSNLMKQFLEGRQLLYNYKHYTKPVDQLFDLEQSAKYYASLEILNAYHSVVWHNQRFYYNPVSKLLEPIGYDGYIEEAEYKINAYACFGYYKSHMHENDWLKYYSAFFRNEKFAEKYAYYLNKFSNQQFLQNYFDHRGEELDKRVLLIQSDFPSYNFDKKDVLSKAMEIQTSMKAFNNISLKAFSDKQSNGTKLISLSNYHSLPLKIVGSGKSASNSKDIIEEDLAVIWSNHPTKLPEYQTIKIPDDHQYIYYKVLGLENIYYSKIKPWPAVKVKISHGKASNKLAALDKLDFSQTSKSVILSGNITIDKPLIISDKTLVIEAGSQIDLRNKAFIQCNDGILTKGLRGSPIKIYSSDKTGQGLLVLKSDKISELNFTIFDQLDNLDKGNYFMTGAVTFYESNVKLNHCQFSNNSCEDALNIIRSDFEIQNMHLSHTFSDGFDADFCTGIVKDSYALNTGNDAFDFSGSQITVENCVFEDIGDKGISAGEESSINIVTASVKSANIGIASKDLSRVDIKSIEIKNCDKAFAAYQKKPEYGPGQIHILQYQASGNKYLEFKEEGSIINFPSVAQ